jgi:GT2 family glycosyltransferase
MNVDVCICTRHPENVSINLLKSLSNSKNIIVEGSTPLSVARARCIQKTCSDWLLFLDDDVSVQENIIERLTQYVDQTIGAVEGIPLVSGFGDAFDKAINDSNHRVLRKLHLGERGYTICTLIRKEVAWDWKPPLLTTWEDYDLAQHILSKGYAWLRVPVEVIHTKSWGKLFRNIFWAVPGWKRFNRKSFLYTVEHLLSHPLAEFVRHKNPCYFFYEAYWSFIFMLAWIVKK